jgi:hypothetical protein
MCSRLPRACEGVSKPEPHARTSGPLEKLHSLPARKHIAVTKCAILPMGRPCYGTRRSGTRRGLSSRLRAGLSAAVSASLDGQRADSQNHRTTDWTAESVQLSTRKSGTEPAGIGLSWLLPTLGILHGDPADWTAEP